MTKLLSTLILFVASSPAFAGICQSYADLPNPVFSLEYRQLPNNDYVVRGTATRFEAGKSALPDAFAYQATPFDDGNGITEYRWQNPTEQTQGLLKIKREKSKVVLSIIWTNIDDPRSIYELQCSDGPP